MEKDKELCEALKDAFDEALIYLDDITKDGNCLDNRSKYIRMMIVGTLSYVSGVKTLLSEEQYDSILPVCRSFLELYPSICYLISQYKDASKFDEYWKKLIIDDLYQDRTEYYFLLNDSTIQDETYRTKTLNDHLIKWKTRITDYFPNEATKIDDSNAYESMQLIIYDLHNTYRKNFEYLCKSNNVFIGNCLKNNLAYQSEFGQEYGGSFSVYPLLCNESHGNLGSLDARTSYEGVHSINIANKPNGFASAQVMIYCLKDMIYRYNSLFDV